MLSVSVWVVVDAIKLILKSHANFATSANLVQLLCGLVKAKHRILWKTVGHLGWRWRMSKLEDQIHNKNRQQMCTTENKFDLKKNTVTIDLFIDSFTQKLIIFYFSDKKIDFHLIKLMKAKIIYRKLWISERMLRSVYEKGKVKCSAVYVNQSSKSSLRFRLADSRSSVAWSRFSMPLARIRSPVWGKRKTKRLVSLLFVDIDDIFVPLHLLINSAIETCVRLSSFSNFLAIFRFRSQSTLRGASFVKS